MKKAVLLSIIAGLMAISAMACIFIFWQNDARPRAVINGNSIKLEVVSSPADMARGLSARPPLAQDAGMLFDFGSYQKPGFWMKDMKFPIDMIWIRDDKVIDFVQGAPVIATGALPVYYPPEPVNYVLEVNAGFVREHWIKAGDSIQILTKNNF